ncbi:MAG: hypothetical protein LRY63_07005 [Nitrincola sp.]|nr:hypothetical protein [Nitrincola sp.]
MSKELDDLRKKAEIALSNYDGHSLLSDDEDVGQIEETSASRVLEELRVYQAELEIQNQHLKESEQKAHREQQRYFNLV